MQLCCKKLIEINGVEHGICTDDKNVSMNVGVCLCVATWLSCAFASNFCKKALGA